MGYGETERGGGRVEAVVGCAGRISVPGLVVGVGELAGMRGGRLTTSRPQGFPRDIV